MSYESRALLPWLAYVYGIGASFQFYLLVINKKTYRSSSFVFIKSIFWFLYQGLRYSQIVESKKDKQQILLVLLKILFIPIMFHFVIANFYSIAGYYKDWEAFENIVLISRDNWMGFFYPAIVSLIFLIDTSIFFIGYSVYSDSLKNKIKSIDTSFFGWLFCLICYPPFNGITGEILNVPLTTNLSYENPFQNLVLSFVLIALLILYVLATIALGFKASNLTNRGIVKNGIYGLVRHPAYTSKVLSWWICCIPFMIHNIIFLLYMLGWTWIYFMRAITEERHLCKDPAYLEYKRKVKYRFIPWIT